MNQHITIMLIAVLGGTALAGCLAGEGDPAIYGTDTGGTLNPGTIEQAGSSTVLPLAEVWAEDFGGKRGIQIAVKGGGSGAGISGICNKELDLGDASRKIRQSEIDGACRANNVDPVEWIVAFDALSVVVSTGNSFAQDLTIEQLNHIFRADGHATRWNEIDASFPDAPIRLCYPDSDSGTYEYFNEAVLDGEAPRTGDGVQTSSNDNVLVTCLQDDQYGIGYFGLAYVHENPGKVRPVRVNGVEPAFDTVVDGTYTPLSRPLHIYTNGVPSGILRDYMAYVLNPEGGQRLIRDVGYVELDEDTRLQMIAQLG